MIVSKKFIEKTGIQFCEKIGYGTALPAGAENIFLLDAYDRGATVRRIQKVIVKHPREKQNFYRKWSNAGIMRVKGVVARRMGLMIGLLLIVRWSFRAIGRGLPAKCLLPLLDGFKQGQLLIDRS